MSKTATTGGFTLCSIVFIVFLIFKLAEIGKVVTWSWWWVFSPLWMPVAVAFSIFLGVVIVLATREEKKRNK
jgi:uncharacterized membrane protein